MTQIARDPHTIDLGVVGTGTGPEELPVGPELRNRLRRRLIAAALALLCLLTGAGSTPGQAVIGRPLWTGAVSLTGFSLGSDSVYQASPGGTQLNSLDLRTGRQRWSFAITELPDGTIDLGNGVAAVITRPRSTNGNDGSGRGDTTITFVRDSTGERLGQTSGFIYGRNVPGQPVLVLRQRPLTAAGCGEPETSCQDITAWKVAATSGATVAWRLSLSPGSYLVSGFSDGMMDGLLEVADDESLRLRDMASGAVVGTTTPTTALPAGAQVTMVPGAVVTARREAGTIVVTAYRQPSLTRLWSVNVPAAEVVQNSERGGFFYLSDCGEGTVCLHADLGTTQIIDMATGAFGSPLVVEMIHRVGGGVFVGGSSFPTRDRRPAVYVVNRANQVTAEYAGFGLVDWTDSGPRALLAESGPSRTGFVTLNDQGRARNLGSVDGANLECGARGDILACADSAGELRVWRLPR